MGFIERLQRRRALWWSPPAPWWTYQGLLLRLRPGTLRSVLRDGGPQGLRSRTDPDEVWRASRYWQRTLLNKWNSREFAQKHGCRVPTLYWYGTNLADLPVASLPEHFVIRPTAGTARRGVYVFDGQRELLDDAVIPRCRLREHLRAASGNGASRPLLVEEFVRSEDGRYTLPTEYKFHTFGDTIAAIEVMERADRKERIHREAVFDTHWKLLPEPIHGTPTLAGDFQPPRCIEAMTACVKRLGLAFGTYARIDYYATDEGPVFSEFSSMPAGGKNITAFADEYLGRLWDDIYPNQA